MQGPMLKALRRFTQLLRVHIYVPGCCKYIRMTNGLQPLVELCMDGCFADKTDLRFFTFADAALYRNCGDHFAATPPKSRKRSLPSGFEDLFQTELSLLVA